VHGPPAAAEPQIVAAAFTVVFADVGAFTRARWRKQAAGR
jgi:hypothetical protein